MVRAASTLPSRPAPNSAANRAAATTTAPPASAGMTRIAVGLRPGYLRDAGEQRRERRLVHVTERKMAPGLDEVQLVLHETVPATHRELDRHEHRRDEPGKRRHPIGGRNAGRRVRRHGRDGSLRDRGGGTGRLFHDDASTASPAGNPRHEDQTGLAVRDALPRSRAAGRNLNPVYPQINEHTFLVQTLRPRHRRDNRAADEVGVVEYGHPAVPASLPHIIVSGHVRY